MLLLSEFAIFADSYQFFVHDGKAEVCPESFYSEPDDQRTDFGSYEQGFITNGTTICFNTCAHLNNHWIQVYSSDQAPDFEDAERVIALPLQVNSGKVGISTLLDLDERDSEVTVSPGQYTVFLLAFNLEAEDELIEEDEDLRARTDLERYKIVLVPGMPERTGVLHGAQTAQERLSSL